MNRGACARAFARASIHVEYNKRTPTHTTHTHSKYAERRRRHASAAHFVGMRIDAECCFLGSIFRSWPDTPLTHTVHGDVPCVFSIAKSASDE